MLKINLNEQLSADLLRIIKNAPDKYEKAINIGLRRCGDQLRNDAIELSPFQTGVLRSSITMQIVPRSKVTVGTNLEYARIHDEGGVIYPKKSKYLTFKVGGRWVRKKRVVIPKYKGRGYLTPAFERLANGEAIKIFKEEIDAILK